ncbi:hypothetical protein [Neosynechococcus sphagnicola]|uniref:immunity protein Imm33 domain-containing protein n=1 Tax=Neosynechococcus sphagnicola TaxID=1501145 RepID=UPI000907B4E2|nr:hypothetical protein [Neosynechococcus sphagnicola]
MQEYVKKQQNLCKRFGAEYYASPLDLRIGISEQLLNNNKVYPINGLRIVPEGNTTGWYIWGGEKEPSLDDNFFQPLCLTHIDYHCSDIIGYLGLSPGWRFLIAPNYEDVWFDSNLLNYQK